MYSPTWRLVDADGLSALLVPGRKEGLQRHGHIFTKQLPKHVEYGCGIADFDREGRGVSGLILMRYP